VQFSSTYEFVGPNNPSAKQFGELFDALVSLGPIFSAAHLPLTEVGWACGGPAVLHVLDAICAF